MPNAAPAVIRFKGSWNESIAKPAMIAAIAPTIARIGPTFTPLVSFETLSIQVQTCPSNANMPAAANIATGLTPSITLTAKAINNIVTPRPISTLFTYFMPSRASLVRPFKIDIAPISFVRKSLIIFVKKLIATMPTASSATFIPPRRTAVIDIITIRAFNPINKLKAPFRDPPSDAELILEIYLSTSKIGTNIIASRTRPSKICLTGCSESFLRIKTSASKDIVIPKIVPAPVIPVSDTFETCSPLKTVLEYPPSIDIALAKPSIKPITVPRPRRTLIILLSRSISAISLSTLANIFIERANARIVIAPVLIAVPAESEFIAIIANDRAPISAITPSNGSQN